MKSLAILLVLVTLLAFASSKPQNSAEILKNPLELPSLQKDEVYRASRALSTSSNEVDSIGETFAPVLGADNQSKIEAIATSFKVKFSLFLLFPGLVSLGEGASYVWSMMKSMYGMIAKMYEMLTSAWSSWSNFK